MSVFANVAVNFALRGNWHLARVEFQQPEGAARPIIERTSPPRVSRGSNRAMATAAFDINEQGSVVNARVEKTSDEEWGREVIQTPGK